MQHPRRCWGGGLADGNVRTDAPPRIRVFLNDTESSPKEIVATTTSLHRQRGVIAETTLLSEVDGDATAIAVILASTGERHFAWVEAGASLNARALSRMIEVAERFTSDMVYADGSAWIGGRIREIRRPDFSPLRLLGQDYLGDVMLFDVSRVLESGSPHGVGRAVPDDLALRLDPAKIIHVPEPLSRRKVPRRPVDTMARAERIRSRLMERGNDLIGATAVVPTGENALRIDFAPINEPLVSIVIPTRGSSAEIGGQRRTLVVEAVRSILSTSSYRHVELVVVADDATPQSVVNELEEIAGNRLILVRWSENFNFSAKINRGAAHASGEFLLILNDDVEIITPDWIEAMLGLGQQPGIGAVGAHLVFEDGTLQHAGHFYRARSAGHVAFGWAANKDDATGSLAVAHEVSGVTGACLLVSADWFVRAGGFSSLLPGNYNDVDFSMKLRALGQQIIWTPWAQLFHFESKTRTPTSTESEFATLRARWGTRMEVDPYWPEDATPIG